MRAKILPKYSQIEQKEQFLKKIVTVSYMQLGCPNRRLNGSHRFSNFFQITAVYSVFHRIFNTMFSNFITSNLTQF